MVGSAPAKPTWLWVDMGDDREVAIQATRNMNLLTPAIHLILKTKITSRLFESTRADLDGMHEPENYLGATEVDVSTKPEVEDGQPRYYGVVYFPQRAGEEWRWRWTPPEKSIEPLMKRHGNATKFIAGVNIPIDGLQIRICKTKRTDMEGWQVAGKPEDGEWVDAPEPVQATTKPMFIYPVVKDSDVWWWGTAYPESVFKLKKLSPGEIRDEFNALMKHEGEDSMYLFISERDDLSGGHPAGEILGATLIP